MAKRKGWDNLSDKVRDRYVRAGISKAGYDAGEQLHGARGHGSTGREKWHADSRAFAKSYTEYTKSNERRVLDYLRSLGSGKGRQFMARTEQMNRLYQEGQGEQAHLMWLGRDKSIPDFMHYYHGIFGY